MRYCGNCGHPLADQVTFCPQCGTAVAPLPSTGTAGQQQPVRLFPPTVPPPPPPGGAPIPPSAPPGGAPTPAGRQRPYGWRVVAAVTAALVAVGTVVGVMGSDSDEPVALPTVPALPPLSTGVAPEPVLLVWWHTGTFGELPAYWDGVAREFEQTHPNVTVEIVAIPPEDMRQRLSVALASGRAPDLFPQWGGGELVDQVERGYLRDVTEEVGAELQAMGASADPWQHRGRAYGLPYSVDIEGFWYRRSLFAQAGITSVPTTLAELDAVVATLRAAGITPIVVGGQDSWQAQHYWGQFALRMCPVAVLRQAADERVFTDPCFEQAAEALASFVDSSPFQADFTASPTFGGFDSAMDIFAQGGAAMQLAGDWAPGLVSAFGGDSTDLGWFPFPTVPGGLGDPSSAIGSGEGFSCHADAPPECVELLRFIVSSEVQRRYGATGDGLPVAATAASSIEPVLTDMMAARDAAAYIATWPEQAYGPAIGTALAEAAHAIFTGQGSPQDLVEVLRTVAAAGARVSGSGPPS